MGVQATVRNFDPTTRSGDVLLDDGSELPFAAGAFDASGLRLLRLGQRVRIETDDSGRVLRLTIPTLPFPK
jgi:2-phospho-L-lactate guanylyltransferase